MSIYKDIIDLTESEIWLLRSVSKQKQFEDYHQSFIVSDSELHKFVN